MDILKMEVIKANLGTAISAWPIEVAPPDKLELTYGDHMRLTVEFDYMGPAEAVTLYGAIGQSILGWFDEIIAATYQFELPESRGAWTTLTKTVDIAISSDISPGSNYRILAKIEEYGDQTTDEIPDCIDIVGIKPTFSLIHEETYPFAYIYKGNAYKTVGEYKTEPWASTEWPGKAEEFATKLADEIKAHGGRILSLKVYADTTPLLWTDWRVEVEFVDAGVVPGISGVPLVAILPIALIIVKILGVVAVIVAITIAINTVAGLFNTKPGLHETKQAWSKETLIATIKDAEAYWKRTPTPDDTLQAMSQAQARDYLDKIAEQEIPKATPWAGILVAGIIGVAALAVLGSQREEKQPK